jgi:hypothetical protein
MLRPSAASEKISTGIRMAFSQYSLERSGTATPNTSISTQNPILSWRIGKIWASSA